MNVSDDVKNSFTGKFIYKTIKIADDENENLFDHLVDTNRFIENAR